MSSTQAVVFNAGRSNLLSQQLPLWLTWVIAFAFLSVGIGHLALMDNNEGMYADIAREMLDASDWRGWVIPHLNGMPYMEKPPLLYWLTAIGFKVFGLHEWVARLVPVGAALACVASLIRFGNRQGQAAVGRLAALIFSTSLGVVAMSHVLMFDMLLTALLTESLTTFFDCLRVAEVHERKRLLRRLALFLALAVLAKGFVALVLFLLVSGAHLAILLLSGRRRPALLRELIDGRALAIFLAVVLPWHLLASLAEPVFPWFYLVNEHYLRFLGRREPHDYYGGAWWYYLPRVVMFLLPWACYLPCLVVARVFGRASNRGDVELRQFLACAWIMPLIFFSISSAKANYYLVTIMPFLAMRLALALQGRDFARWRAVPMLLLAALMALIWWYLRLRAPLGDWTQPIFHRSLQDFTEHASLFITLVAMSCALLAMVMARYSLLWPVIPAAWIIATSGVTLKAIEPRVSSRPMAELIQQTHMQLGVDRVCTYRVYEQVSALAFYVGRPLCVVDSRSADLYWGNRLQPNGALIDDAAFLASEHGNVSAMLVPDYLLEEFRQGPVAAVMREKAHLGAATLFLSQP